MLSEIKEKPINYFTEFDEETGKMVNRITFTICRRIFDHMIIVVTRGGSDKCNGRYYFHHLDARDCPVFIQDIEEIISDMADDQLQKEYESRNVEFDIDRINKDEKRNKVDLLRQQIMTGVLDVKPCKIHRTAFDPKKHEFTWSIGCDMSFNPYKLEEYYDTTMNNNDDSNLNSPADNKNDNDNESENENKKNKKEKNQTENYYVGQSIDMMPPTSGWQIVEKWAKYDYEKFSPVPMLDFYNRTQKLMKVIKYFVILLFCHFFAFV